MKLKIFICLIFSFYSFQKGYAKETYNKEDSLSVKNFTNTLPFISKSRGTAKETLELGNWALRETNPDTSWVKVGGAFRLNAIWTHYEGKTAPLGTFIQNEWTWDTWWLEIDAYKDGLQFAFQYRFFPTFNTHFIKFGWVGYRFNENNNLQFGITQVPFGLLTYASHNWWFQLPYYIGLEDDHQMGFNYTKKWKDWTLNGAYFLMSEPRGTNELSFGEASTARYSYDVVPIEGNNNIERHQWNLRAARQIGNAEVGFSLQTHQVFNQVTFHTGRNYAAALHYEQDYGRWNLKTQALYYSYNDVRDDDNNVLDVMQMGAYGFGTYDVASKAAMYLAGLAYDIPVSWGPIKNIQLYNNYTYMQKFNEVVLGNERVRFANTQQNVFGALVTAGHIYAYFDIARGVNHPWLTGEFGGNALGTGRGIQDVSQPVSVENPINNKPGWNTRLNINMGYYF